MSTTTYRGRLAKLATLRWRLERWRSRRAGTRRPGAGIPEGLWSAAVTLAGSHGISRTASALRLDYYSLKKRLERHSAKGGAAGKNTHRPAARVSTSPFWELAPAAELGIASSANPGECTLELEDAGGNKLRVQLRGLATPDLAALCRGFWNPAS